MSGNSQSNQELSSGSSPVRRCLYPVSNSSNMRCDGLQDGAGQGGETANVAEDVDAGEGVETDG